MNFLQLIALNLHNSNLLKFKKNIWFDSRTQNTFLVFWPFYNFFFWKPGFLKIINCLCYLLIVIRFLYREAGWLEESLIALVADVGPLVVVLLPEHRGACQGTRSSIRQCHDIFDPFSDKKHYFTEHFRGGAGPWDPGAASPLGCLFVVFVFSKTDFFT